MTTTTTKNDARINALLAAREELHPELVAAMGTDRMAGLIARLSEINEDLADLGAIPMIEL